MKIFLKHLLKKNNLLLISLLLMASFVRFYNFPSRVTFWSEQARSLIVSANYIKLKPSLLGQEYFREDSNYHVIYSGAFFNYSLVPLLIISNYEPVVITIFFALLNLLTGLVIYLVVKKMFGLTIGIISMILFLFNDFMIYHSLFIWNYNYLPLIGILVIYFSWLYRKKGKRIHLFLNGLLCGIGISIQFLLAPVAAIVLLINLWKKKRWTIGLLVFILALILGNLPMVLFDIRHNFYETRTLLQYFIDTLKGKSGFEFAYYYFLPFWPLFTIISGWIIYKMFRLNKYVGIFLIIIYILLNLTSPRINWNKPTGMPDALTTSDIEKASKQIAADTSNNDFNVAEVLDFDKQAYVLRYFVEFRDAKTPLGITEYPNINLLYVLSQKGYNFDKSGVWEIYSGGKYKVSLLSDVGSGCAIYKLTK